MSMFRRRLLIYQALMNKSGNIVYPGLIAAWSAKGKSNDDEDRATLKDLTGNGHDITLNGFAFSKMSGYGGYNYQFNKSYYMVTSSASYIETNNKIIITAKDKIDLRVTKSDSAYTWNKYKINIKGLLEGDYIDIYGYYDNTKESAFKIDNNGIHIIPKSLKTDGLSGGYTNFIRGAVTKPATIEIEILPEYPDALVFDGVDDYGINKNVPILTDFTVIAKRKTFKDETSEQKSPFISKMFTMGIGAFAIEGAWAYNNVVNFGANNIINYIDNDITFVTKNNYNEQSIISGSFVDNQGICIGAIRPSHTVRWKGAIYSVYLFDRSLDKQEIKAFIRKYIDPEYLLPSEILTPDCYYDFSQGSNDDENRDTIKDYSGNGNDAVAYNFAWRGMSGYGGHNCYFSSNSGVDRYEGSFTKDKAHITKIIDEVNKNLINIYIINNFNIKISGLTGNNLVRIGPPNVATLSLSNGTHKIDSSLFPKGYNYSIGILGDIGECDITIEILPEYPGALVFDGVDDYISLDAFDSDFKTMFMVCKPFKANQILYDQRSTAAKNDFALYTENAKSIAYNGRNKNGTYINNKLSNYKVQYTLNKKQLITVKSELTEIHKPNIGCNQSNSNFFANMTLYKFLGFKEALTEEQIQTVIKKYNLLDGVDEIEVS